MKEKTKEEIIREVARNGRRFYEIMVDVRRETGIEAVGKLADAISEASGVDRQYIIDCCKAYRKYCEENGLVANATV